MPRTAPEFRQAIHERQAGALKYRRFGNTGLEVSEVVFGGGAVGGLLINADDETRRKAIRMAVDAGINWIDTAASYGNGKSEEALGWLLKEMPESMRPHISTKVRLDPERGDFKGQVEKGIADSLSRLDMDRVDLFQVHNSVADTPTDEIRGPLTSEQMAGEVADAMDAVREQGLTRHVGFTATGEAAALHRVLRSGRYESAQVYYNLLNPSAGKTVPDGWSAYNYDNIIATAAHNGVAVMNIRVLAAGVIATDQRHGREGGIGISASRVEDDEARMKRVLEVFGEEHGTRAQVAIRYSLGHPGISCVVVGLAELEHLRLAIEAAEMGRLPEDLQQELEGLATTDFGRLG